MFKRVVSHKGFWKSAVILGFVYMMVLGLIQWAILGFSTELLFVQGLFYFIGALLIAGFICGFMVSYGKFWGKLKQEDYKK